MIEKNTNKTKKRLNIKSLLGILSVLILLMAGAYYYFFSNLRAMGETISTLGNETDALVNQEGNLDSLRAVFSDTTTDRQKITSYFVQSDGAIDFITTIEQLAAFSKLTYETEAVNTQEEEPLSASRELLHLNFSTSGNWQNTFYFISMLESLPFNITISRVNLHATGDLTSETVSSGSSDSSANNSSSSVSVATTVTRKGSIWEGNYDFTVVKLK